VAARLGAWPHRLGGGLGLLRQGARLRSQLLGLLRRSFLGHFLGCGVGRGPRLGREAPPHLLRAAPVDRHRYQFGAIVERPVPCVFVAFNPQRHAGTLPRWWAGRVPCPGESA